MEWRKLHALVYDILPPVTATTDYAIGQLMGSFSLVLKWQLSL